MANYTNAELLNEVSRVFQARISPGREGGTLNTRVEYGQLLDSASLTFLLQNDAIFYLARLVRNTLLSLVVQELRLVEDTLLALDYLGQIGEPVRDTTILSNANTALLSLDAAGSVQGRPEADRFSIQMDRFAELHRQNVVSATEAALVRPREEARGVIKSNLDRMKKVHAKVLDSVFALRDLLDEYIALDIPSKVAATALTNVRNNLSEIEEAIPESSDADNIAASRANVLTTLASKTAVNAIANFSDPRTVKVRSPSSPHPPTLRHFGRVTGTGTPASVLSSQGPWTLPLSSPLVLSVDGGTNVQVYVNEFLGTALRSPAEEPFLLSATVDNIHAIVDPRTILGTASGGSTSSVDFATFENLSYKSLGAPITFPNFTAAPTDDISRAVLDLRLLQTGTISFGYPRDLGGERYRIQFSSWSSGVEPGNGLDQSHVGDYFKEAATNERWEILAVESANTAVVSVPTIDASAGGPVIPPSGVSNLELRGDTSSTVTAVEFTPAVSVSPSGQQYVLSPAVKTATLSISPDNTVAGAILSVQKEQGDIDTSLTGKVWRPMTLNQHVQIKADPLNPTRFLLVPRSRRDSYLVVGASFIKVLVTPDVAVVENSAHTALGLLIGQSMTEQRLAPIDLAEFVETEVAGLTAEVNKQLVTTGTLSTVQNTSQVTAPELDGVVEVGDQLVLSGAESGVFSVESLSPITLDRTAFQSTEESVPYQLTRTKVTLSSANSSRGSSLEVVSGPSELGFSVGLVYGSVPYFEAVDKSGNLLSFADLVNAEDILDVVGLPDVAIDNVNGTTLELVSGLPSNTEKKAFEVRSSPAIQYDSLVGDLITFTSSRQLLQKHGFDVDLEALDVALTRSLLPGQNFTSNRNQAKRIAADLLSILTSSPRRADEYDTNVPTASLDLETMLTEFTPSSVAEVDSLLDSFLERKYSRAVKLLQSGKIREFFDTNEETGSFAGTVMSTSRQIVRDLPALPTTDEEVDADVNVAVVASVGTDAEFNLDDTES
jgi:hypothetical protein